MTTRIPWQRITCGIDFGIGPDETVVVAGVLNPDGTFSFTNKPMSHAARVEQDFFLDLLRRGSLLLIPKHEGDPDLYIPPGAMP